MKQPMYKTIHRLVWLTALLFCRTLVPEAAYGQQKLRQADSLFAIGQYRLAQETYQEQFRKQRFGNPNLLLKMAFIAERNGAYTQCLYYLSCLAEIKPSVLLYSKMDAIAVQHGLQGYAFNDLSYLILFLKSYGDWLYAFLLIPGVYVLFEILRKYRRKEYIRTRHKGILLLFFTGLLVFFNLDGFYREGIVSGSPAFARESPSSAASVAARIEPGNKVIILKNTDHWKLVIWERRPVYIRSNDIMPI